MAVAEMPYHVSSYNARWVLHMLDGFMHEAHAVVKILICDAHLAHCTVRRLFLGVPTPDDKVALQSMDFKFLNKLTFRDVPDHNLPRLPLRLVEFDNESYHLLPACCACVCKHCV